MRGRIDALHFSPIILKSISRPSIISTILDTQFSSIDRDEQLADAIMERILSNSYRIELMGETIRPVRKGLKAESLPGKEEA